MLSTTRGKFSATSTKCSLAKTRTPPWNLRSPRSFKSGLCSRSSQVLEDLLPRKLNYRKLPPATRPSVATTGTAYFSIYTSVARNVCLTISCEFLLVSTRRCRVGLFLGSFSLTGWNATFKPAGTITLIVLSNTAMAGTCDYTPTLGCTIRSALANYPTQLVLWIGGREFPATSCSTSYTPLRTQRKRTFAQPGRRTWPS